MASRRVVVMSHFQYTYEGPREMLIPEAELINFAFCISVVKKLQVKLCLALRVRASWLVQFLSVQLLVVELMLKVK